jgi:uncharacterized protein (TIGR02996 family)
MTDRDALYRAILISPTDDAPRLVYADWLDEHGDPDWAALIRAMIRLPAATAYFFPLNSASRMTSARS